MIYTPLTKKAILIMYSAHEGQSDKSGLPYVFHPFHVAEQMDDEYSVTAALLHDVIEDTELTVDELRREFPGEICDALELLTKHIGEPYMDYIKRLAKNPIAKKVKMADLLHNSDMSRLDGEPDREAIVRFEKYKKAYNFLTGMNVPEEATRTVPEHDGNESGNSPESLLSDKQENLKKKIEHSFTIASFNICSAHFMEGKYTEKNLLMLAEKIKESKADVVALQEVDLHAMRSEGVNMTESLAEHSGFEYSYFIKIRDFQGGEYGTAIISKFPIHKSETLNFNVKIATQGTSCGYVVLDIDGEEVTLFNTHLSVENEEANTETMICLRDILHSFAKKNPDGFLCCGDFNTGPEKLCRFIPFVSVSNKNLFTYADRSIDNILCCGRYSVSILNTIDTSSDGTTDHNMLIGTVEF